MKRVLFPQIYMLTGKKSEKTCECYWCKGMFDNLYEMQEPRSLNMARCCVHCFEFHQDDVFFPDIQFFYVCKDCYLKWLKNYIPDADSIEPI